ncbi:MAG: transposase, partial [Butyrivibrio sp.]|nr:transposase [Butyrivibrio sp.]
INQKIKTLRRHGYGYPDDEYFFLKIMDMSRKEYVRNQPSHKICD